MQLFRSQLSRFIPHPHRDSWMRNNLGNWLYLLRVTSFLTLVTAGCFTIFYSSPTSPIGRELDITKSITRVLSYFKIEDVEGVSRYTLWSIGAFFIISGILSFRCGSKQKPKHMIPVFISFITLLICLIWLLIDQRYHPFVIIPYIIPVSCPFVLLLYRQWQNKLDHWNYFLATILLITATGHAASIFLTGESIVSPTLISLLNNLGIESALTVKIMKFISTVALAASLLLFIPFARRLALITFIIITSIHLIIRFTLNLSTEQPLYGLDYWGLDLLFHISYIMYPSLILLSLASRKKTQTLRL